MQTKPLGTTRYCTSDGTITQKLRSVFSEVSPLYLEVSRFLSEKVKRRPLSDYGVREVHLIGSVVRGVDNSDLDVLVLPQKIDQDDYRFFKLALNDRFFNNRPKPLALDWYVRPYDEMPERAAWDITSQLKNEIGSINRQLGYLPSHS